MNAQHLLSSSLLDILFEGRNKEYGAYELRKSYSRRLFTAMAVTTFGICAFAFFFYQCNKLSASHTAIGVYKPAARIIDISPPAPAIIKPAQHQRHNTRPAALKSRQPLPVKAVRFAGPPITVKDPKTIDIPPANAALDHVQIAVASTEGSTAGTISQNASADATDAARGKNGNAAVATVEKEASYPGGQEAWRRFLVRTFRYPLKAADDGIEGIVNVQFIVDTSGIVSDVKIISGPVELRDEALRVIGRSGRWTAAIQNGHKVKSYKLQPVTFRISME